MKISSSKRRVTVAAVLVLLALFFWRPGASRLKSRIIYSISAGVGRPVDVGSVHIQLLPRPGFDLENLIVYDDAAFGGEPILRASAVSAALRLTSLLRGRLEIARLDLTEPSLNLVHGDNGKWNLEALLERTAQIPLAPTGKAKSEPRPGFPYIEASSARINLKSGNEKRPYALTNTDFALWQESENSWGIRLKGQPVRTDLGLTDIGLLQIVGTWQRAQNLRDTPIQIALQWKRAQLGQVARFLSGSDKGWRGEIELDGTMTGTPAKLQVSTTASIDDFRRYDIASGSALRLAGQCDGQYSFLTHDFHEVLCSAPVGQGLVTLTGDVGLLGSHRYAVLLRVENVPASSAVALLRRAKKNLSEDLVADGTIRGSFELQENANARIEPRYKGRGEVADFHLSSPANKAEFGPWSIPFELTADDEAQRTTSRKRPAVQAPAGPHLEVGPVTLSGGRAPVSTARGWINRSGYYLAVTGDTEVATAMRLGRVIGIPELSTAAEGTAQLDLQVAGSWVSPGFGSVLGFSGPQAKGTVKLRNVRVDLRSVGAPPEIASADVQLLPDQFRVTKLNVKAAGTNWSGSLEIPHGCSPGCPVHFVLNANQIVLSELREWASPSQKRKPWYRVLGPASSNEPSLFAILHANGHVHADQLIIHGLAGKHVSAEVVLDSGKLQLSKVIADFVGGKHHGEWQADFTVKPAVCKGSGAFSSVSLSGLADAMHDRWISGTADATYEVRGKCPADFWPSAQGSVDVELQDGTFPPLASGGENPEPLHISRMNGHAELRDGEIRIKDTKFDSSEGQFELRGTVSLNQQVDVKMTKLAGGANAGFAITGDLSEPQYSPLSNAEQAKLKTTPAQ